MRRRRTAIIVTIAAAGGVVLAIAAALPPGQHRVAAPPDAPAEIGGSLHVHTERSDGAGTMDEVSAAAARAGVQFVVFTDHGDAMRPPEPPQYRSGVLCVDAVEISTTGGHYIAINLDGPAPYRLAGEPRDVIEDVARLGGFGVVAHPDSPKPELAWREWLAPFDALEWLNADSEWRDEPPRMMARAMTAYLFRPAEAIASVFGRPPVLGRWDAMTRRRRVVALAGHDAHARIGLGGNWEPAGESQDYSLRLPSYESAFRTFSLRARLDEPPTGDARRDARLLVGALRAGHVYTVIDALATPGRLSFTASAPEGVATGGDDLLTRSPVQLDAAISDVPGAVLVLLRDGRVAATAHGASLRHLHEPDGARTAVYRVEARLETGAARQVPWIVSNPIRILTGADPPARTDPPPAVAVRLVPHDAAATPWLLERDRETVASVRRRGTRGVRLQYELAPGPRRGQYAAAALTFTPGAFEGWDRVRFRARASGEMRISVQVREPLGGRRWIRSVVLGPDLREIVVRFDEMRSPDPVLAGRPPRAGLASLLFVVDTTHTPTGASGEVTVESVQFERAGGGR